MPGIGDIRVNFIADTAQITTNIPNANRIIRSFTKDAEKQVLNLNAAIKSIGSAFTSLKTVITGAVLALGAVRVAQSFDAAAEKVDQLGKAAKRLGIGVPALSALSFAAEEAGVEFDSLATLASKALKNIGEAVSKGETTMRIGRVNVQLTDAQHRVRDLAALLPDLARGIQSAGSQAERLKLAEGIFGRAGGDQFVQLLNDLGGRGLDKLNEKMQLAQKLGVAFTQTQVDRLTDYRDAVGRVEKAWFGVRVAIMTEIAPVLTDFLNALALRVGALPELIRSALNAVRTFANGDPAARDIAARALGDVRSAVTDLLRTSAIEIGRTLGIAILEAVKSGFAAIGPDIADVLRDNVGPILNQIPGVSIAKSEKGKLADLREELEAVTGPNLVARVARLRDELQKVQESMRLSPEAGLVGGKRYAQLTKEIEDLQASPKKIQALVRAQENLVAAQRETRDVAFLTALTNGFGATATAADRAKTRIDASLESVDRAVQKLNDLYHIDPANGEGDGGGKPTPFSFLADRMLAFRDAAELTASDVQDSMRRIIDALRQGAPEAYQFMRELDVRNLRASGDEIGADRLRMQLQFVEEQRKLMEQAGSHPGIYMSSLLQTQAAELKAFDAKPGKDLLSRLFPEDAAQRDMELLRKLRDDGTITEARFTEGATKIQEALDRARAKADDFGTKMKDAIEGFARSASDAFADLVVDGKANFEELAKSWTKTLLSMALQQFAFQPLFNALGSAFGPAPTKSANGNVFANGRVMAFASGGVVGSPTLFPMARGVGLMGEAGPEAIMPLQRIGGKLGVRSSSSPTIVNVIDQRSGGERAQVRETQGPDGSKQIDVLILDKVEGAIGRGKLDHAMRTAFGARRAPRYR